LIDKSLFLLFSAIKGRFAEEASKKLIMIVKRDNIAKDIKSGQCREQSSHFVSYKKNKEIYKREERQRG
jgi:hypothetical protein